MKIAYIAPTGVFGGVRIVAEHLNRLTDRGHECVWLYTDAPMSWLPMRCEQRPLSDPGAEYERVVGTAITTWPRARLLADDNGAAAWGLLQMAEWLMADKGSEMERATMEAFTAPMDGVMAISEWLMDAARAVHDPTKVWKIRNGIDTGLFYPDPFPEIRSKNEFVIVTEGYEDSRVKDLGSMVPRALRRFRYDHGARFRLIGFSQFQPRIEYDAFWMQPSQVEIRRIYSSADVFLKASRYEGRPGPDVEAMACGVAVCRAIGTGGDDLRHEQNALVSDYWDDGAFLANLIDLYDHPEKRARIAQAGLEYVRQNYQWDGAIDLVEETLTGTVNQAVGDSKQYRYDLAEYDSLQDDIVNWETPQAIFLGETLNRIIQPRTVIDIGCGPGSYLVPFKHNARVLGVDGAPAAGGMLERDEYVAVDLRQDESESQIELAATKTNLFRDARADLALCIETAEHLPPDRAEFLVDLLVDHAAVVFFSAAQPGQGGTLHLNERPRDYWLGLFRERGFDLHPKHDWISARIAENPNCQRVRWLIGNAMLLTRVSGDGA